VLPGTNAQQLNNLLTEMDWDEEDLNRQRVELMSQLPTEGDGILLVDDTGFGKKGSHSVGVARQYSGTLGKVANCQITVHCHYAEPTVAWPVNTRLYLPKEEWAQDPERRRQAQVPEEIAFATKPELGLQLIDQALAWGVPHAGMAADAGYGDNPPFLNGLETRHESYVVGVHKDFAVAASPTGPAQPAETVLSRLPGWRWRSLTWREGTQGKLRARFAAVRCWRVDGAGAHRIGWLIGQKPGRGQQA
jgi:SRSO17 transposase